MKRKRGFIDVVMEDMETVGVKVQTAVDRVR